MLVNIKVTGGLNIESGQIDPKATQGLNESGLPRAIVMIHRFETEMEVNVSVDEMQPAANRDCRLHVA